MTASLVPRKLRAIDGFLTDADQVELADGRGLDVLETDVSTAQEDIDALEADVSTAQEDIASLDHRVKDNRDHIAAVEGLVAGIGNFAAPTDEDSAAGFRIAYVLGDTFRGEDFGSPLVTFLRLTRTYHIAISVPADVSLSRVRLKFTSGGSDTFYPGAGGTRLLPFDTRPSDAQATRDYYYLAQADSTALFDLVTTPNDLLLMQIAPQDPAQDTSRIEAVEGDVSGLEAKVDGLQGAVQDIIVGDLVDHNWQDVNSDGSEGGIGENHDTTNLAARGATYSAPSFSDGNTDNFILLRVPAGADVRRYQVLISGVEGAITANLLLALGHSTDAMWDYYGYGYAEINAFAGATHTVTLQISDRVLAHTTFAGQLGATALAQVDDRIPEPEPRDARKERVAFEASARVDADDGDSTRPRTADLAPIATDPISVVSGAGDAEFITAAGADDITVSAGVYLGYFEGSLQTRSNNNSSVIQIVDDADPSSTLIQSSTIFIRGMTTERVTKIIVFNLAAETKVRVRLRCEAGDVQTSGQSTLTLVRLTGDPSSVAALEAQQEQAETDIAELEADVARIEETELPPLERAVRDIIVHTKTRSLGLRDVNTDGSEGGIAFRSSWDLDAAQAATYTAPTVAAASATGDALFRIPIANDARRYEVVIAGLGTDTLSHLAIRRFHDASWQYWDAANFQGEFAVSLRYNPQQVTVTTEWDGDFGEHAAEQATHAVFGHQNVLLWEHTARADAWHPSGERLASGVSTKIYAGIGGDTPWRGLEAEIRWTERRNSVDYEHIGLITFPGWRTGSISTSNPVRLHGFGRFGGLDQTSTLNAILSLVRRNDERTSASHLFIEGFNPDGNTGIVAATMVTVRLFGIR